MSNLFTSMLEWAKLHLVPLGLPGLIFTAFAESSFFPIPPDIILIPLALLSPENAILYGLLATLSSSAGAFLGYWIGLKGGRPVLRKLASEKSIEKAEAFFNRYGAWAVGIAAFTPIPYKVFTIASGVFMLRDLRAFFLASFLGRGGRFMAEAILIMLFGESIISFLTTRFEQATLLIGVAAAIALIAYSLVKRRSRF
ncbi:MAG: DedA family protein [Thaumarchaeota archaeon]|nr:MAG: DedA family protein [Nitrososphaerota archaeon]